jgi:hypothetical protein
MKGQMARLMTNYNDDALTSLTTEHLYYMLKTTKHTHTILQNNTTARQQVLVAAHRP